MRNARLIRSLKALTPGEMRRFIEFISSSFFCRNPRLLRLGELMLQAYPDFQHPLLEKESLIGQLFPGGEKAGEQALHKLFSQLFKLLERFLAVSRLLDDEEAQLRYLTEDLQARKASDWAERSLQRLEARYAASPQRDTRYFFGHLQVLQLADAQTARTPGKNGQSHLGLFIAELDRYYAASRLKAACEWFNRRQIIGESQAPALPTFLLESLQAPESPLRQEPAIYLYYEILMTYLAEDAEPHFRRLVQALRQHVRTFSRAEAYQIMAYAQNYCIRRINQGDTPYLEEIFALYEWSLEEGILLEGGRLAHEHYKNITTVGLRLRRYDWVRSFLESNKARLDPEHRLNAYTYNLCAFYYEQQSYSEALRLLQQVEFSDIFYHLSARSMLLKIYFELEDDDAVIYQAEAFKAFLKRHAGIPESHVRTHHNLIRFVVKASRLRQRRDWLARAEYDRRHSRLLEEIAATRGISNADWLRKQVEALASQ